MYNAYISGIGYYVPDNIVTNDDLAKIIDTTNDWIVERTGIKERRHINQNNIGPSDLAIPAVENALSSAKLSVNDIDLIIFATSTPDYYAPGSGCLLQEKMGFPKIGALDIRMQCSGFIYGLSIAEQYIKSGTYENILVVGSEVQSTALDLSDNGRDTAVIFADGAGAAILSSTDENQGILSMKLRSEGKFAKELWVESPSSSNGFPRMTKNDLDKGKHFLKMNGQTVFKLAVKYFPEIILESLDSINMSIENIDLLIPHQANIRIIQMVQKKLGLNDDRVFSNIEKYGNTTAASIPIAICEAYDQGKIKKGDIVALAAFGSGFAWGSTIIKW
tara:strand:- start:659 stop:1657 length:999 start_codon:yes stop_codon:yes gene_type:complete